jgi:hypothetical protein
MAGRRLREAVKETLISNSNGEFNNETHVVIAGLTNTYSQYIATFEEYHQQRYEVRPNRRGYRVTLEYKPIGNPYLTEAIGYPFYC